MKQFWKFVARFLNNKYVQLSIGMVTVASGLVEFWRDFHKEGDIISSTHGVTLLGFMIFIIALERILSGGELLADGTAPVGEYVEKETAKKAGFFHRLFKSPRFQFVFGLILIISGLGEAFHDLANPQALMQSGEGLWYIGILLIGMKSLSIGLSGLAFGLMEVELAERQEGWHLRFLQRLNSWVRKPSTEFTLAWLLIVLGLVEQFIFEPMTGEGVDFEAHQGMILYAITRLGRLGTTLYDSLELAEDAHKRDHKIWKDHTHDEATSPSTEDENPPEK